MVSLLEILFATIALIWGGRLVYRQSWHIAYKAIAYAFVALLVIAMWNRPLAGEWGMPNYGPLIAFLATIGVVLIGNWAHRRWGGGADDRPAIAIVVVSILLVVAFWLPIFLSGPSAIMPSMPTGHQPVISAPDPGFVESAPDDPSSRKPRAGGIDCRNLSPRARQASGVCP